MFDHVDDGVAWACILVVMFSEERFEDQRYGMFDTRGIVVNIETCLE